MGEERWKKEKERIEEKKRKEEKKERGSQFHFFVGGFVRSFVWMDGVRM